MDTRNMYMEIYGSGCAIGNVYSVPAWAKSERLEYSVSLAEIWRMGESAVGEKERWNLKRFFNNSIKTCLHTSSECATADSFRKMLFRKPLSGQL